MDEDDSQDELINRSSKGKRVATWAISDNSDEAEEAESESGEEDEEEGHLDEDDDEDEDEEEDEEDEEEEDGESKPEEEGACAGTSADAEGSSDEEAEKCPICLHSFSRQPVATPENCEHYFCLDCILEWSKNANSCPIDRTSFKVIYLRTCFGGKVQKMITIQKPAKQCEQDTVDVNLEETSCEVCGGSDREDRLLLCDGCDAGYHMECLTPPLDAVPVEEWFCPECEPNNRQSRGSAAETSDTDSLPSTARTASRRSRQHTGQTRAIARTQHSERVRANVNRHRITQARTQEFAPTYLIRSTWLDETINAVVAGLNSAVYVRDFTSRPSTTRRRKSKKPKGRKTSSKGKKGKAASTGVKRRKRKVRRTRSRRTLVAKKTPTPRSRIANSLGIVKDKKGSSLPTVYRPSESTLSSMRADIGAASLSIYGDPFDLDPFTDREDDERQPHDAALLEAKRRGISRSAFRSHQPVARPISLTRRPVSIPRASPVAEAAPVPDLLGSILSGQNMLLMDSSDVIINRDGSLKTTKPMTFTNSARPGSRISSSGDGGPHVSPGPLPDHMDSPGSSDSSLSRHFSSSSSPLSPTLGSTFTPSEMSHSLVPPRGNPHLLGTFSQNLNGPNQRVSNQITNGVRENRQSSLSPHVSSDSSRSKASAQSHFLKAPTKPMWMDVSVLPRIPKIKRESSSDDAATTNDSNASNMNGSSYGMPDTIINRLAGDKERGHSVDQQHGRTAGPRNRPDGAGSSSGFSSSFSSSSSATASHTNHQRFSSGSSSSSSVSFRINSSGNSWHSRRLNIGSLTPSGSNVQENSTEEEKKRQLHRDKQKLLASRSKDSNNIYDPFNPTESDSGSSDGESGSFNVEGSSRLKQEPVKLKNKVFSKSRWDLKQAKVETKSPQDSPVTPTAQETLTQQKKGTKVNAPFRKSRFSHIERPSPFNTIIKKESESDTDEEGKKVLHLEKENSSQTVQQRLKLIKTEKTVKPEPAPGPTAAPCDGNSSATSTSSPVGRSSSSPVRKSSSSPVRKSSSSPTRKSASSHSRKSSSSPVRKSTSSPKRKSTSSPTRKSKASPTRKSTSSPTRKSTASPTRKSASSPSKRSTSSPSKRSTSSPSKRSTSSPTRKSASSPTRKFTSSPTKKKSTASPTRKSASSPSKRSTSSPTRKSASSPTRKSASSPTRKSKSSPTRKSTSSPVGKLEKIETKSESLKNKSKDLGSEKHTSKKNSSTKDQRARSSSTERPQKPSSPDRDRRHGHTESKHGGGQKEKDKAKSSKRSRSKERKTHRDSDSSHSRSPDRTSKKKRRSRSRSKDRRRSRSYSSSSSRERSRTKKHKKHSKERIEDNDAKRRSSKDKRRDRSRSKSRSRSRSRDRKRARSRSKSKSRSGSRSKERRKTESRRQSSRDEAESRSKDKKRHRSRSNSKEKKKERPAAKAQKTSENSSSSVKDKKPSKEKAKDDSSIKPEKASKTNKSGSASSNSSSVVKQDPVESKVEEKPIEEAVKNDKTKKEIKKEKCTALDMFEDSPTSSPVKKEELDIPIIDSEIKCQEEPETISTEVCEPEKPEATSPEEKPSESDSSIISVQPPTVSTPPQDTEEQSTELPTVKQEPLPLSSDSEDDFNVDVMLDNLDLVKSRLEDPTEATPKEEKSEGEATTVGTKSKTQVKRVTWNIEEPVGPQPEKSASKVALYKLKLKQEGIRRPAVSTASQDITGTGSGDVTKSSLDPERSLGSDTSLSASAPGQADDGDLLKKDKTYLKKLHMQERAIEEVKLAIKPFYQKRDINKDEYKEILRKAVQKVCHSKSGEINPVKVGNLVKAYVDKYKHARKYKKGDETGKSQELLKASDSP